MCAVRGIQIVSATLWADLDKGGDGGTKSGRRTDGVLARYNTRRQFFSEREVKIMYKRVICICKYEYYRPAPRFHVPFLIWVIKCYVYRPGSIMATMKRSYAMALFSGLQICKFDTESDL